MLRPTALSKQHSPRSARRPEKPWSLREGEVGFDHDKHLVRLRLDHVVLTNGKRGEDWDNADGIARGSRRARVERWALRAQVRGLDRAGTRAAVSADSVSVIAPLCLIPS
eukprot:824894-Rhodomonas_salina.1